MTTVQNRIKARLLAYASDCYARDMGLCGERLLDASDHIEDAKRLRSNGRTWAEFQWECWRPYKTDYGTACAWSYAILHVVAREESALLFIPRRSSKAHDESDRLKVSFVSKCSHVFDIRARRCVECGVTEEEVRRVEADS